MSVETAVPVLRWRASWSGSGSMDNIIMVEGGGQTMIQAGVSTAETSQYTHIPEDVLQHKHLQKAGVLSAPLPTYHH